MCVECCVCACVYSAASNGGFIFRSNRLLWPSYLLLAPCHTQIAGLSFDRLNPANLGQPHENEARHLISTLWLRKLVLKYALLCIFKIQMKAFNSFYETNTSYFRKFLQNPNFKICKESRNRFQGIDSVSLCSLAGRNDNPFWRTNPPGNIGWRRNRSLGSLNR